MLLPKFRLATAIECPLQSNGMLCGNLGLGTRCSCTELVGSIVTGKELIGLLYASNFSEGKTPGRKRTFLLLSFLDREDNIKLVVVQQLWMTIDPINFAPTH